MPHINKERKLECQRRWYKNNKEKVKKWVRDREKINAKWIQNYKKKLSCACGESDSRCIDFHHLDPKNKLFTIGGAANRGKSLSLIKEEIKKCIPLCANCHRKITHQWSNPDKTPDF